MSDIYQKWNEQGILRKKLLSISFLINAGIPIEDICKKENISLKQFYELRKKYSDLADVSEKGNLEGLYFCIDNLIDMAEGYTMRKEGKEGYKTKTGQDKFKLIDIKVPVPKNLQANAYLLEKGYGKQWLIESEKLALAEKKAKPETWEDELDDDSDDEDNGD